MTGGSLSFTNTVVAKLSPTGSCSWSKIFSASNAGQGRGIAVDNNNNILITGYFVGPVDFGGGPLSSSGLNIFVAKYSPSGAYIWAESFGGVSSDVGNAIDVDNSGNVLTTGYFQGTVDFGGGLLSSHGGLDIFLVKLAP